jgi:hypothetical protein
MIHGRLLFEPKLPITFPGSEIQMDTATKPASSNGAGAGDDGRIPGLSPEMREKILCDLLREVFRSHPGETIIRLLDGNGEWLGNLVAPGAPAADADRLYAELPPQTRQEIMRPLLEVDLDDTLTDEEVKELLKPESRA